MKLQEILKARGITDEQLKEVQEQDIPAAAESFQRIMDIYYLLKVTADMESAYWYNRVWWEMTTIYWKYAAQKPLPLLWHTAPLPFCLMKNLL